MIFFYSSRKWDQRVYKILCSVGRSRLTKEDAYLKLSLTLSTLTNRRDLALTDPVQLRKPFKPLLLLFKLSSA